MSNLVEFVLPGVLPPLIEKPPTGQFVPSTNPVTGDIRLRDSEDRFGEWYTPQPIVHEEPPGIPASNMPQPIDSELQELLGTELIEQLRDELDICGQAPMFCPIRIPTINQINNEPLPNFLQCEEQQTNNLPGIIQQPQRTEPVTNSCGIPVPSPGPEPEPQEFAPEPIGLQPSGNNGDAIYTAEVHSVRDFGCTNNTIDPVMINVSVYIDDDPFDISAPAGTVVIPTTTGTGITFEPETGVVDEFGGCEFTVICETVQSGVTFSAEGPEISIAIISEPVDFVVC